MASAFRPTIMRQVQATRLANAAIPVFRAQRFAAPRSSPILQRATFQTSAVRAILPPLPQKVVGTVNDAAPVNGGHPAHGSYHWTAERLISAAILPITIAPFAAGALNPLFDSVFIGLILVHSYIGFQACITDYFPKWRVPVWRSIFEWANVVALFLVGWGWYEFETHDVGLTAGIKRIWSAGKTAKDAAKELA